MANIRLFCASESSNLTGPVFRMALALLGPSSCFSVSTSARTVSKRASQSWTHPFTVMRRGLQFVSLGEPAAIEVDEAVG